MEKSRDRSFCCGGGGLMLFYEPEEDQRMGVLRVEPCFFLPLSKEEPGLKTSESLSPAKRPRPAGDPSATSGHGIS